MGIPSTVTVQATFYDGTAVPSLELNVKTTGVPGTTITTDADGVARITVEARFTHDEPSGWDGQSIHVTPARPEEGEIQASTHVIVFPSEAWLTAKGALSGTTLSVEGRLDAIDFPGMNAAYAPDSWRWPTYQDITGGPLGSRTVSVAVTRVQHVRRQVGTHYDFIEKKVTPEYELAHDQDARRDVRRGDRRTTGEYRLSVAVPVGNRPVRASGSARPMRRASDRRRTPPCPRPGRPARASGPSFLIRGYCGSTTGYMSVGLDERFELTMHDGDGRTASEGRFLWLVSNRGLRDLASGTSPSFSAIARTDDLPRFTVRGVQVTKAGYVAADAHVAIDLKDLTIDVQLQADRERYAPGGRATVDIRTIGPDGRPIAADVVVQGIDEKLYDVGAAREVNVLGELHGWVSSGILQSFSSHRVPYRLEAGGCGATGGGGSDVRDDFGDVVLFDLVRTDADGRATVTFDLLDDLTSWRVSAMALTADHRAGTGSTLLPVGLPFFVEGVLAPEYLVGDVPVLRVRAYGDALDAGDAVTFTVSSPSLGLEGSTLVGSRSRPPASHCPALPVGTHRIRISAEGPGGRTDAVIRTIRVVPSRLETLIKHYEMLTPSFVAAGR